MRWISVASIWIAVLFVVPVAVSAGGSEPASGPAAVEQIVGGQTAGAVEILTARLALDERGGLSASRSLWSDRTTERPPYSPSGGANEIQVAGRCGSSDYTCSPPTGYCCENSTDGLYCTADVNGC